MPFDRDLNDHLCSGKLPETAFTVNGEKLALLGHNLSRLKVVV